MTKDITMNTPEAELKAVAKAMGSSLKRAGHAVPHSIMLHALAGALNKRDWHSLKASLETVPAQTSAPKPLSMDDIQAQYTPRTLFFLRLALSLDKPVSPLPSSDTEALAAARTAVGETLDGVLRWSGWNLPAALNLRTSTVDAGDFTPEVPTVGQMALRLGSKKAEVQFEVAFSKQEGWYLTSTGSATVYEQLNVLVPQDSLFAAFASPAAAAVLAGPMVSAEFWTDDRAFEVNFDARAYLMQASDRALQSIIEVGYRGDDATDAVALFANATAGIKELDDAFDYLAALQRRPSRDSVGFECSVEPRQFLTWMAEQRPAALAKVLCSRSLVDFVQADEPEIMGEWNWLSADGRVSDTSFATREEAEMDAYETLGLFQETLDEAV